MGNVATRPKTAQEQTKAPSAKVERSAAERLAEIEERCQHVEERLAVLIERADLLIEENEGMRRALRSVRAIAVDTLKAGGE